MNRHRILAVASKEWREILRDRLFFTGFYRAGLFDAAVWLWPVAGRQPPAAGGGRLRPQRQQSRLYRALQRLAIFHLQGYLRDERQAGELLSSSRARAVIIIPRFGELVQSGQPAQTQTLLDGTFPSRALIAKGYVTAINAAASLDNLARHARQWASTERGAARAATGQAGGALSITKHFQHLGGWHKLIMFILIASPPFLTALGVVREKERGSIFNLYASNTSRGEFLLGKLAPYVAISTLNILILWALAVWLYGVPFKGDPLFFLLASVVYVLCTTGIGLLVSVLVRTQMAAMIVTLIVTLVPAILYSGFIIPIPSLKPVAYVVAHLMPAVLTTPACRWLFSQGGGADGAVAGVIDFGRLRLRLVCAGLSAVHQEAIGMNRDDLALWALRLRVMLGKELRQLLRDRVLLAFIVAFSVDIFLAASRVSLQLNRAATLVQDFDLHRLAQPELTTPVSYIFAWMGKSATTAKPRRGWTTAPCWR
ncbi:MAG: ABC transporter permease [Rivihabitans pingtungensis]